MQPPFKRVDHIHIKLAYYNISQVICINIATKFKDEGAGGLIKFYAAILKKIKQTHSHRQCTYIPFSITCILNLQYVYTYVIDMLYICSMFNVLGVTNRSNAISIWRMYCILTYHIGGSRGGVTGVATPPLSNFKNKRE